MSLAEIDQLRHIKGMWLVTVIVSIAGIFDLWLNLLGLDPQACRGATQRLFSSINSFWAFYVGWWALRTGR